MQSQMFQIQIYFRDWTKVPECNEQARGSTISDGDGRNNITRHQDATHHLLGAPIS